jgi:ABC-type dipeptide/oligopeptide/nickel transport system permease component
MATTLAVAAAVVGVNLVLDLIYRWLDPRVRIE